ncbi:MAG: MauE/DoxX family redox-associated membrane protein [Humidesulfovibrio sp.]|nr:MauE/DoxX family redox-associated membrane protein [Humidesulfovibrio sp.]
MKLRDLCRLLLGGALLTGSLIKVSLPEQFVRVVASYGMVPEPLVLPVSMGLPFVEMALGSLLAFGFCQRSALSVTALLSTGALASLAWALAQGADVDCLCLRWLELGRRFNSVHLLGHGLMATLALSLLRTAGSNRRSVEG